MTMDADFSDVIPTPPASQMFNRTERLVGTEAMKRLGELKVIVFGVGGVGSWTAEALVRSGVGHVTIVDADRVAVSNINRQLMATTLTVGRSKVDVLRERLAAINPHAEIVAVERIYSAETAGQFNLSEYDYVVDAIDSLADKALLLVNATSCGGATKVVSSMGAALKMDPTRISVAEFWKVKGCPLAAALRRKFKKSGVMPRRKIRCVYSDELIANHDCEADSSGAMSFGKAVINGAVCHITAIFGMTLAGLIVGDVYRSASVE